MLSSYFLFYGVYNLWKLTIFTVRRGSVGSSSACFKAGLSSILGPAPHRVHRVVTSAFWRTFSHEGKISLGWWGWGVHAHPLSLHLPSPIKLQCTLQLSGQIHWPCFISCKDMYSVRHPMKAFLLLSEEAIPMRIQEKGLGEWWGMNKCVIVLCEWLLKNIKLQKEWHNATKPLYLLTCIYTQCYKFFVAVQCALTLPLAPSIIL